MFFSMFSFENQRKLCFLKKRTPQLDSLRQKIIYHYEKKLVPYRLELDHSQAILVQEIRKFALVLKEDYNPNGIVLNLRLSLGAKAKLEFILKRSLKTAAG